MEGRHRPGASGFVGKVHRNGVVLAFPKTGGALPSRAELLQSGNFISVWVDVANFRHSLKVESS